jgi:hypothetical protein
MPGTPFNCGLALTTIASSNNAIMLERLIMPVRLTLDDGRDVRMTGKKNARISTCSAPSGSSKPSTSEMQTPRVRIHARFERWVATMMAVRQHGFGP